MSNWFVTENIDLSALGAGWDSCFLSFTPFSFKEVKSFTKYASTDDESEFASEKAKVESNEEVMKLIREHFVEGKIYNGKSVVDATKKDLDDMPFRVYEMIIERLIVSLQKKTAE